MKKTNLVNVLILGSGGREHAIAWKIAQSKLLNNLYVAPGNSGTSSIAKNIPANINNFPEIRDIIITKSIDLLIIGPEDPLVNGLRDELEKENVIRNLKIIGPKKRGAQLEGSKLFAKQFMKKYNIPTADFKSFNAQNLDKAIKYLHAT